MKKNLNKRIRLQAYEKMLAILQEYYERQGFYPWGYCWMLPDVLNWQAYNVEIKYFPELYKRKPPRSEWVGAFWFYRNSQGTLKRIKLLEEVIAEMKK